MSNEAEQRPSDETCEFSPSSSPPPGAVPSSFPHTFVTAADGSAQQPCLQATEASTPFATDTPVEGPELPGRRGQLHLAGEIARGGMGAILKGRDVALGREIAVKVLLEEHTNNPELAHRFVEEARIAGQLQHPGVAPVYELGVLPDRRPYFTMKLVRGQTLAALLKAGKDVPGERLRFLGIYTQVCQTLAYAHAQSIIHRDLKPANVMVGAFGEVQVMDWGLAKLLSRGGAAEASRVSLAPEGAPGADADSSVDSDSYTQAGTLLGTPAYMAPEQARGEVDRVDERADVFGLGAILCEVLTGAPPYLGNRGEVTRQAQQADLTDAWTRLDACGADAELIALARRCLAAERSDRPRHAGQVADEMTAYQQAVNDRLRQAELERAAADARAEEEGRTRLMAEARALEERRRRRLTVALVAAVLLLGLLGGGGWYWVRQQEQARWAETTVRVEEAISEAYFLRGQAESRGDVGRWTEAVAAARRAEALADSNAPPALTQRTEELLADMRRSAVQACERAAQAEKDRELIARLLEIRSSAGDRLQRFDQDFAGTDAAYAQAVRDYGIDLDALSPAEAGDWLVRLGEGRRVELAACLDDWAHARRIVGGDQSAGARQLTQIAGLLDPDPLRQNIRFAIARHNRLSLRLLAALPAVQTAPPVTVNLLAVYLGTWGDVPETIQLLRSAQQHHPGDFQINHNLSWFLLHRSQPPQPDEALRFATAALAARPQSLAARLVLASACTQLKRFAEAVGLYQELIRRQPQAWCYDHLGALLLQQGKTDQASAALRQAIALDPEDAFAHRTLRSLLLAQGKQDEAFAECVLGGGEGERGELIPNFVRQGRLEDARAIWQTALKGNPASHNVWYGHAELCLFLGHEEDYRRARTALLARFGKTEDLQVAERVARACLILPAPEDEWRQANALVDRALAAGPGHWLHYHFKLVKGLAEYRHDHPEQAIPLLRESASRIGLVTPRLVLAMALYQSGRQEEGRQALAAALTSRRWEEAEATDVAGWIDHVLRREAEELMVPNLAAYLQGQYQPHDNSERLALIAPCRFRKHYRAAALLYADAFGTDAMLAEDLKASHRYQAACCAALAGTGQGEDGKKLSASERTLWCRQAVSWLKAELAACDRLAAGTREEDRALVRERLQAWRSDSCLAPLRDEKALARLPAELREACSKLRAQLEALAQKVR